MGFHWALRVSNPRPPRCKRGALATELSALKTKRLGNPEALRCSACLLQDELPYIENELPQPQVLLALGLLMLKPRRLRSSWKSTVTSPRYIRLRLSTTTGMPWNSNTSSSFGLT